MKNTATIEINGTTYAVHELTVCEIDAVIGAIDVSGPLHRSYNVMGYDMTPEFVAAAADIDQATHGNLTPSELDQLIGKVEEVNARFLDRVRAKAGEMTNAATVAATTPHAPSSATTPAP